ncbi:MAG: hypothetical protein Q8K58_06625 [Acidimicrobiales bacterium]|nr:hypothetical protein [Acidimicrobiales bacterium]
MPGSHDTQLPGSNLVTLRSLLPLFCPEDVDDPIVSDEVMANVQDIVASLSGPTTGALRVALGAIEAAGLRHGRRFSHLPPARQRRSIAGLARSRPGRRLVRSVRDVVVVAYFDRPAVKGRLGYDPAPWTAASAAARAARWGDEIQAHEVLLRTPLPRARPTP